MEQEQKFRNMSDFRRPVSIRVTSEFITFHFVNENNREFYWIPVDDWATLISDGYSFQQHMEEKSWYSEDMSDFINETLYNNLLKAESWKLK